MPPDKFKYQGLQRAVPVGRRDEVDFGGLGLGERAEAAGGMQKVGGAAERIQGLVAQGISSGKSDRTIGRQVERATALLAGKSPGSNIRVNPRSFSQQAAAGGLEANWRTQMRESTNSFFGGESKWWNNAMVSSGVAARQQNREAWSFADDPGLGAPSKEQWSFANDPGLGYSVRGQPLSNLPSGAVKSREDSMADEWYPDDYGTGEPAAMESNQGGTPGSSSIADSRRSPFYNFMSARAREREFGFLYDQGAGGMLFDNGRDNNFRNLTMSSTLG